MQSLRQQLRFTLVPLIIGLWGLVLLPEICAQGLPRQYKEATEQRGSGLINWTEGAVSARGVGVPSPDTHPAAARAMAFRAAKVVASRNLLETVQGIRVDSETIVENYVVKSDTIKQQVTGVVQNARVEKRKDFADGSVEVFLTMPLWGKDSLTSVLLDEQLINRNEIAKSESREGYTGVVLDTRGIGLQPATFPSVLDEEGDLVYGPSIVSRQAAERKGLVQYYFSGTAQDTSMFLGNVVFVAQRGEESLPTRAGRKPLRVKGIKKSGTLHANIVISLADAKKIRNNPQLMRTLQRGKVIIITDPLVAGVEG